MPNKDFHLYEFQIKTKKQPPLRLRSRMGEGFDYSPYVISYTTERELVIGSRSTYFYIHTLLMNLDKRLARNFHIMLSSTYGKDTVKRSELDI